jgi:hypothetical protein
MFGQKSAVEFFAHAESVECFHCERQKRLADVKTRKLLALNYNDTATSSSEQGSGGTARRSTPDDGSIVNPLSHALIILLRFANKEILASHLYGGL